MLQKIGFGGSCHWCTEAIFQCLKGVSEVQQGWLDSEQTPDGYSEGVVVYFDDSIISLQTLIAIHLYTHSCTANHSMRDKYRSAVYVFTSHQSSIAHSELQGVQAEFDNPIITQILSYNSFKLNEPEFLHYYASNPQKPFCQTFINPKLQSLMQRFGKYMDGNKVFIGGMNF